MVKQNFSKLYVLNQFYPPDYAPTGQLIKELVDYLSQKSTHIRVFTGQPAYAYNKSGAASFEEDNGVLVYRSRVSQLFSKRIRGQLLRGILYWIRAGVHLFIHARSEDTLLLTTAPPFLLILGYVLNRLCGVKYVCLVYDLYPDVAVNLNVFSRKHWLVKFWQFLNSCTLNQSEQIIAISSTMKEKLAETHPGIKDKISVIHTWANPNWIVPIPKEKNWFAKKYDLLNFFTVMYSGNMGRAHDMKTILDAAFELRNDPIKFLFIGDGQQCQYCIDQINDWNLKNCQFLPYQDDIVLPYSLTACDLALVSIGERMEGLVVPSKLYSILASGRPVAAICEKNSYIRQFMNEALFGKAFENGDSISLSDFIRQLAGDRQLAENMGQAGRSYLIENFTLEIIAEKYAKVLNLNNLEVRKIKNCQI